MSPRPPLWSFARRATSSGPCRASEYLGCPLLLLAQREPPRQGPLKHESFNSPFKGEGEQLFLNGQAEFAPLTLICDWPSSGRAQTSAGRELRRRHGPVMAKVFPGDWALTNR